MERSCLLDFPLIRLKHFHFHLFVSDEGTKKLHRSHAAFLRAGSLIATCIHLSHYASFHTFFLYFFLSLFLSLLISFSPYFFLSLFLSFLISFFQFIIDNAFPVDVFFVLPFEFITALEMAQSFPAMANFSPA